MKTDAQGSESKANSVPEGSQKKYTLVKRRSFFDEFDDLERAFDRDYHREFDGFFGRTGGLGRHFFEEPFFTSHKEEPLPLKGYNGYESSTVIHNGVRTTKTVIRKQNEDGSIKEITREEKEDKDGKITCNEQVHTYSNKQQLDEKHP